MPGSTKVSSNDTISYTAYASLGRLALETAISDALALPAMLQL